MSDHDESRDVLLAYRAQKGPHPRAAEANWQALVRRIDAGEPAPALDDHASAAPASRRPWLLALAAAAAALIALRLAWPEGFTAAGRSDTAAAAPYHHTPDPAPRDAHPRAPAPSPVAPRAAEPVSSDTSSPAPDPPAIPRPAPSSMSERSTDSSDLSRELALVRSAAHAVRDGLGGAALERADTYLSRYPRGVFVPEARLRRIEALCLLDRKDDARAEVAAFLTTYPDSPLRERVQSTCN